MTTRLVVLASGSGTNLQAIIDAASGGRLDVEVVLVVSDQSDAGARERARRAGIAEIHLPSGPHRDNDPDRARRSYDTALADQVTSARPDWIVLAGWMRLLSSSFLDQFPGRVINLHPALPGEFPGAHAIDDAWQAHLDNGLDRTGVMVHLVPDERVDEGPVLASREVPFVSGETRETIEARIHAVEHDLLVEVLADLSARVV